MALFKKSALALAVSSFLVMGGCGGGGGPSDSASPGTPDSGVTVAGSAVKGVMKQARVTAYELDDRGDRLREVGTAVTGDAGEYSLQLNNAYAGGAIEVEITATPDTRMRCDASAGCAGTAKGADLALPAGFALQAILDGGRQSRESVSGSVSPWTSLATQRAKALVAEGHSISKASKQASAETSQIVGFDIAATQARDIDQISGTSTTAESQYAVMNAAVAEILFAGSIDSVNQKLLDFSKIMDDGKIDSADLVKTTDIAKSIETVRASSDVSSKLSDEANAGLDQNGTKFESETLDPEFDADLIVDDNATQAEKIEKFQAFVSQVRTWATTVEELDGEELTAALDVDIATVRSTFDDETQNQLQLVGELLAQVTDYVTANSEQVKAAAVSGETLSVPVVGLDGVTSQGAIDLTASDEGGLSLKLAGAVTPASGTAFVPFDLVLDSTIPVDAIDLQNNLITGLKADNDITLSGTISDGQGHSLTFTDTAVDLQLTAGISVDPANVTKAEQDLEAAFQSASLDGAVAIQTPNGGFTGSAKVELVRLSGTIVPLLQDLPVSLARLKVAGEFVSDSGSRFSASVGVNIENAAGFDTFGWLEYSESRRSVPVTLPTSLLPETLMTGSSDVVTSDYSIVSNGNSTYRSYFNEYLATGEKSNYYELSSVDVQALAEHFTSIAKQQLVGMALTGYSSELNKEVSFTLTEADLELFSISYANEGEPSAIELFTLSDPGFGVDYAYSADGSVSFNSYYEGEYHLSLSTGSIADAVLAVLPEEATDLPYLYLDFRNMKNYGIGVEYRMPASATLYESCLADPVAEINRLAGWDYGSAGDCAYLTLNHNYGDYLFSDAENADLNAAVRNQVTERFGRSGLLVDEFFDNYGFAWVSEGQLEFDYSVGVQFADLESDSYFLKGSITASAQAQLPQLPAATVTATVNRASRSGGSLLADVVWNGGAYSLKLSSQNVGDNSQVIDAVFSNAQGYKLDLDIARDTDGAVSGVIGSALIGSDKVGSVEMRNGIPVIVYPNGDVMMFESLL